MEVVADGVLHLVRRRHPLLDLAGAFPGISAATDLEGLRDEWRGVLDSSVVLALFDPADAHHERWVAVDSRIEVVGG